MRLSFGETQLSRSDFLNVPSSYRHPVLSLECGPLSVWGLESLFAYCQLFTAFLRVFACSVEHSGSQLRKKKINLETERSRGRPGARPEARSLSVTSKFPLCGS